MHNKNTNYSMSRIARLLLGFAAFLGVAGTAAAAGNTINLGSHNVWTVYAFGNAQAVADAFRALANFSASGTFQSIVSMIAVLGILGVGMSGGFNQAVARNFISYTVGVFLISYVFFGVTNDGPLVVNVEVIDTVDMTWKAPVTVPAVVGIPASIISSAGYRITEAIEASFQIPTELKMSRGAPFNLATSMLQDASQAKITDPNLASSFSYYVQDCFTIGVAQGALRADSLIWSTDFLNDIKFNSKAVMVNTLLDTPVGTPSVVTCEAAWGLLNTAINAQGSSASSFLKDASAWSKTPAMSVVNAAADSAAQWATNSGVTDGGALVKQAAVLSTFRGAYSQAAAQTGNSEFLTSLAITQATESQRSSWIVGAEVFNKTMGYVFAIIQVFVYAITPLVLCAALVPGLGLALLKNFLQILLWMSIWQPMLAIVNFIIISMQQADVGGALSNGASAYGFTLANVGIISERTANLKAAASFVGTMVPALAWAMVKGSVDFSRVIGAAVGENFAQSAANTMTTGNYSLNQASMDSFTANKHSTAATGAWGEGLSNAGSVGSRTFDTGGSKLPSAGEQQMNISSTAGMGTQQGGMAGSGAQLGNTGSDIISATAAKNFSLAGQGSFGGGHSLASQGGTNVGANIVANASLVKPGNGGGGGKGSEGGQGGAPGQGDVRAAEGGQPGQFEQKEGIVRKALDRVGVNASGSAALSGHRTEGDNFQKTNVVTTSGGATDTGSRAQSGGTTGSTNNNASQSAGYNLNENVNITGISPTVMRAQAAAAYMRPDNTLTQGKWGYDAPAKSEVGDKITKLNTNGAVQNDVEAAKLAVATKEQKLTADVNNLAEEAKAQKVKNEHKANRELSVNTKAAKAAEAPAQVSATNRFLQTGEKVGKELYDSATSSKEAVAKWAGEKVDEAKEKVGLGPKHNLGNPEQTKPQPGPAVQPGDQRNPANGEHSKPGEQRQLASIPGKPGDQRQPGTDSQKPDEQRQVASEQGKPADQRQLSSEQERQLAAVGLPVATQGQQQLSPEQERHLAAVGLPVATQGGQLQTPAGQDQSPQVAMGEQLHPQPGAAGSAGVPSPSSSEQGMTTQGANADSMMASTEDRKASDLPGRISEARDISRMA